jgi:Exostosin family
MIRFSCRRALLLLVVVECLVLYAGYLSGSKVDGILTLWRSYDDKFMQFEQEPSAKVDVATNETTTTLRTGSHFGSTTALPVAVDQDQGIGHPTSTEQVTLLQQVELKYELKIQYLRNLPLRYYVYNNWPALQLIDDYKVIKNADEPYVFSALLTNNTWRVTDPAVADLFFAPTPLAAYTRVMSAIQTIMRKLTRQPSFKNYQGHRHVVFALGGRWFDVGNQTLNLNTRFFNGKWAPRLENVTVAREYDAIACQQLSNDQQDHGDWNHYYSTFRPISKYTFSLGLLAGAFLPFIPASYEKFAMMNYTIFYHTRTTPSDNGSTPYRWAPLNVTLPFKASIGYDIDPDLWMERFTSSKFCLVIRGDDSASHALLRAVKVGCIPVVISDHFPMIGQTFKTSLDMRDFSIFLDEKEFLKNPQEQLASLQDIPELEIRTKLIALRYAQQVTCPDHPDSLFLPALMLEANSSFQPTYTH